MGKKDFGLGCTRCSLKEHRTQVVYGLGSLKAHLLLVGEAPGEDEDRVGKPFVGRSGSLVDDMLEALKIRRGEIFITNTCLCRPVNEKTGKNRTPTKKEIRACRPRLRRTLKQIGQYIVTFGRRASDAVLGNVFYTWGRPIWSKRFEKWIMPVKHPSWYLHGNMKYLPFGITEFVDGVKEMRRKLKVGRG